MERVEKKGQTVSKIVMLVVVLTLGSLVKTTIMDRVHDAVELLNSAIETAER